MPSLPELAFHAVCHKKPEPPEENREEYFVERFEDMKEFIRRFDGAFDFRGKSVLDIGCGHGGPAMYMALNGAARVVGIDTDSARIEFARGLLCKQHAASSPPIEFMLDSEIGNETFDIVLSKDSYEHFENPEQAFHWMRHFMKSEGELIIGFSPLWKSPIGGHIDYMTSLPWAHVLFPEKVIMKERRRFRPLENAESFAQIRGGLNKMTLHRFESIIESSGLLIKYIKINASSSAIMRIFDVLRKLPFLREYFTVSIYVVLEEPRKNRSRTTL